MTNRLLIRAAGLLLIIGLLSCSNQLNSQTTSASGGRQPVNTALASVPQDILNREIPVIFNKQQIELEYTVLNGIIELSLRTPALAGKAWDIYVFAQASELDIWRRLRLLGGSLISVPSGRELFATWDPVMELGTYAVAHLAAYAVDTKGYVFVQGGSFNNGSSNVTLSSFFIDRYEITQASYQAVMGTNPSYFSGNPNRPVERVTWFYAIEYCNRRSMQEGLTPCYSYSSNGTNPYTWPAGWNTSDENHTNISCNWTANGYRLPTEMEWMFAARGGNLSNGYTYSGSNIIDNVAWYSLDSDDAAHTVGTKLANELGMYDVSGNVCEWCWDIYDHWPTTIPKTNPHGGDSGYSRTIRGGGWRSAAIICRIDNRSFFDASKFDPNLGLRVVRNAP